MYVYGTTTGCCVCTCMVLPWGAVYVRVWYYHWVLCTYVRGTTMGCCVRMYVYGTTIGCCVRMYMVLPWGAVYVCSSAHYMHVDCLLLFSAFYLLCMVVVVVCITEPQLFHAKYSHAQCIYSTIALTCVHVCMRACMSACV